MQGVLDRAGLQDVAMMSPALRRRREIVRQLRDTVLEMSDIELKLALCMVVEGADVDFAIDRACYGGLGRNQ